ncbi:unnamed protein product [Mycena citricolor]|uniref:DDE-1 domain-containing protein n=1 Tax=Mycena citricolor TaxID=2018698 RepID=A0AAD2JZV3_9AGAR|nr:unnamed protein product [Mycena citricolor]
MKEWMQKVLGPYVRRQIKELGLSDDQKSVLYIDFYPVHTGKEFWVFVHENFPHVIIIFVPANCTPVLQPADVGLQRVYKHHIKQSYLAWMVQAHQQQIAEGFTAEKVKFTTLLPELRKAWEKCEIPADYKACREGYHLGKDCLTSKQSKADCRRYMKEHPELRTEIEDKIGEVLDLDIADLAAAEATEALEAARFDEEDVFTTDSHSDHLEVPLPAIIHDAFCTSDEELTDLSLATPHRYCVEGKDVVADGGSQVLRAGSQTENIWGYDSEGRLLTEDLFFDQYINLPEEEE